jgi:hypothetical protein
VRAEPRIRTGNLLLLGQAPLPVGLVRHGATARFRTECLVLTEDTLCRVSYGGMAGEAGLEPTHPVANQVSCHYPIPQSPRQVSNPPPSAYKATALPEELRGHRALGGIRTLTGSVLNAVPLPLGYVRVASLWPGLNGLPPTYEVGALPGELQRRESWGTWIRTRTSVSVSRFRAGRVASYTIPH